MVDPQASQFWRFAVKSGLLDDEAVRACWEKIPEDKRTADAVDRRLARQAVNAGLLTVWQAQQLLTGRATGFKIDRYLLLDLIGQGGMGRVYLAKDTRLGRRVAIKVLSKERMSNPRAIARFQREAKVGAQLQHENLVRIYDQGESSGIHYLVMEYIDGRNVAQIIGERGSIAWPEAARLARQIALGLEHAQQKGLIHRDVNPANILVTREGVAKLADLGLAIDLADEANVTRDGATVGTFDYISPEQARHSREVDTRADIYSLGCTLYHMLSGRVPFPMPSLPEKLYAHQLHDAEPLTAPEGERAGGPGRGRPADDAEAARGAVPDARRGGAGAGAVRRAGAGILRVVGLVVGAPVVAGRTAPDHARDRDARGGGDVRRPPAGGRGEPVHRVGVGPRGGAVRRSTSGPRRRSAPRFVDGRREPRPRPKAEPKPEAPVAPPKPRRKVALSPRARKLAPVAIGLLVVVAAVAGIAAVVAASRKKLENRPIAGEEPDEPVAEATENPRRQALGADRRVGRRPIAPGRDAGRGRSRSPRAGRARSS